MTEKEYSYSLTEDEGFSEDVYDCIQEFMNQNDAEYPFELEIYKGEVERVESMQLLPELIDKIDDNLSEISGEWSHNWFNKLPKTIQKDFEKWFEKYLEENDCKIDFHNVGNIEVERWIVRSDDDYEAIK